MDKYSTVLQIFAILIICFLIYVLYRFIVSNIRRNRLKAYSINLHEKPYSEKKTLNFIYATSDILEKMIIFNNLARTYDRYTFHDKDLKKGMDYISIKILLGIILILVYLFIAFLYKDTISVLAIIISFILGFIIPDFYCIYLEGQNRNLVNKDILKAIIIMNNSYKANRSTEQAIIEVTKRVAGPVKIEFSKVLNDIRLGLSMSDSFKRMYERTNIKIILDISHVLSLVSKSGANLVDVFEDIETRLLEEEKLDQEIQIINHTNFLSFIVFSILPILFLIYLIISNEVYFNLIISNRGILVVLTILILYILYILIIWRVIKGVKKYD